MYTVSDGILEAQIWLIVYPPIAAMTLFCFALQQQAILRNVNRRQLLFHNNEVEGNGHVPGGSQLLIQRRRELGSKYLISWLAILL